MIIKKKKWLYIGIENKSREYLSKLFLTILALKNDFNVVIGHHSGRLYTNFSMMPKGIYMDNSIWEFQYNKFTKLKHLGFNICATDEEGLVYRNPSILLERVSPNCLKKMDLFFTWGKIQASLISTKYPELKDKLRIVGNPRVDIIREEYLDLYKEERKYIRKRYGKFILINSNFPDATTNTLNGKIEELQLLTNHIDDEKKNYLKELFIYQSKLLDLFVQGIEHLAKSTNLKIIIRPHPSEDPAYWISKFKNYDNIECVYKFSANPWILESEILIHNGCTTAIESLIMNKPAITYRPIKSNIYDQKLPNLVSKEITNEKELIKWINIFMNNNNELKEFHKEKLKLLEDHISLSGELSTIKIINQLKMFNLNSYSIEISSFKKKILGIYVFIRKNFLKSNKNISQKFPGIKRNELFNDILKLKKVITFKKKINILEIFPYQFILFTN